MEYIQKFIRLRVVLPIFGRHPLTRYTSSLSAKPTLDSCDETVGNSDEPVTEMSNPFQREKQKCILCRMNIHPDWKNVRLLSQFQSQYTGRIYGRHITGLCSKKQEEVSKEIVKAQNAGLMPYYLKDPIFTRDPKLYNPDKPIRPHPY